MEDIKIYSDNLCPICGNNSSIGFTVEEKSLILICSNCRHLYWERMPTENEIISYYSDDYTESHQQAQIQESNREYYKTHVIEMVQELGADIESVNILDFGSSYPVLIEEFLIAGGQGLAVDYGQDVLNWSKQRNIPAITPLDIDSVADQYFDILRLSHVLEHLIDPIEQLQQLIRKLKPGGIIHITQPNFPCFKLQFTGHKLQDAIWPSHLHFFSPLSIKILMEKMNCKIYRFDTHPLPEREELERVRLLVDLSIVKESMSDLAFVTTYSTELASYPWYLGLNSGVWAKKLGK